MASVAPALGEALHEEDLDSKRHVTLLDVDHAMIDSVAAVTSANAFLDLDETSTGSDDGIVMLMRYKIDVMISCVAALMRIHAFSSLDETSTGSDDEIVIFMRCSFVALIASSEMIDLFQIFRCGAGSSL